MPICSCKTEMKAFQVSLGEKHGVSRTFECPRCRAIEIVKDSETMHARAESWAKTKFRRHLS